MKESFVGALMVIALLGCLPASAIFAPNDFQKAYHDGALANVEFRVLDEVGNPIRGAKVNVFFDMADRSKGVWITATTDTNGVCIAEAKTKGVLEIEVSGEGYYRTKDKISLIVMGQEHEVKGGRWMPWGMRRDVVLRPVSCPKAIRLATHDWIDTKVINEWVGFDLQKYDYVAPVGKGEVSDMEIKFDWDGNYGSKHNGMAVSLRFPTKFAGGYYSDKKSWSDFTGVYSAQTNEVYEQNFHYERRPIRDAKGRIIGGEGEKFDQSKVLVVRSRCIVDAYGNFVSAQYAELFNLQFSCTPDKSASIKFNTIYNPAPNDTNLEPK